MTSRPAILIVLALAGAAGCHTYPLVERPLGLHADLTIVEERAWGPNRIAYEAIIGYFTPVMPFFETADVAHNSASFESTLRESLVRSGLFEQVTGAGDAPDIRQSSPLRVRVHLRETHYGATGSAYCLGFLALPLFLIGFPTEYSSQTFDLAVECLDRDGGVIASGAGRNTDLGFQWIYGTCRPELAETLDKAMADALEPCLGALAREAGVAQVAP